MRREGIKYQDDATTPKGNGVRLSEKEKTMRKSVAEVLQMHGYEVLHGMFLDIVQSGTQRVLDPKASMEEIRYWQGVVSGVSQVQRSFVALGNEEDDIQEVNNG